MNEPLLCCFRADIILGMALAVLSGSGKEVDHNDPGCKPYELPVVRLFNLTSKRNGESEEKEKGQRVSSGSLG